MKQSLIASKMNNTELSMYHCGTEQCKPGHDYGPVVRDHFLIHYILGGKGEFHVGDKTYSLEKHQGFLICPGIVTYYKADHDDPWHYSWVGFHGSMAESYLKNAGLSFDKPIFTYDRDNYISSCLEQMTTARELSKGQDMRLLGLLYLFLSQLIDLNTSFPNRCANKKEIYIKKAIEFIEKNYSRKITIVQIAKNINLDRSYMGTIFKEHLNASPQEYLLNTRMNKACELMGNPELSIGDISRSVGYDDVFLFSKMFKKNRFASPREYRKKLQLR